MQHKVDYYSGGEYSLQQLETMHSAVWRLHQVHQHRLQVLQHPVQFQGAITHMWVVAYVELLRMF
jgi:hypothetical protein